MFLVEKMVDALVGHYRKLGFERMIYKEVPHIYTKVPANEDSYALFRAGFRLERCGLIAAICPGFFRLERNAKRGIKKAVSAGVKLRLASNQDELRKGWHIIESNLWQRYKVNPTHSWQEISRLLELFPENISFAIVDVGGEIEAALVCFHFSEVVHAQYIAASKCGMDFSVLCKSIQIVVDEAVKKQKYFSFGTSNNLDGSLNYRLYEYKSGFGGVGVIHNIYHLTI